MIAPVGVLAEEAGDAELCFAPHLDLRLPLRVAHGNRVQEKIEIGKQILAR
jgi:hypothetical protein